MVARPTLVLRQARRSISPDLFWITLKTNGGNVGRGFSDQSTNQRDRTTLPRY